MSSTPLGRNGKKNPQVSESKTRKALELLKRLGYMHEEDGNGAACAHIR
jgi:hypothetical protein